MRVLQGFWGREHEPVLGNTGTTKINVAFDDGEGGKQIMLNRNQIRNMRTQGNFGEEPRNKDPPIEETQ